METDGRMRLSTRVDGREITVEAGFPALNLRPGSPDLSPRQPLARALGKQDSVVDATAGLAHDAYLMACLGYRVTAVEQSPVLHALAENALDRLLPDSDEARALGGRLCLLRADAVDYLSHLESPPDAIYIDPMFPPKRRESALPRKEIQLIRVLVGEGGDAGRLLRAALAVARNRVVVKRPHYAGDLGVKPHHTIASKLLRYDVYQ